MIPEEKAEIRVLLCSKLVGLSVEIHKKAEELNGNLDRTCRLEHEGVAIDLEEDVVAGLLESATNELKVISTALDRLKDDTYGICDDCGDQIAFARLKARPEAAFCLRCQERLENIMKKRPSRAHSYSFFR